MRDLKDTILTLFCIAAFWLFILPAAVPHLDSIFEYSREKLTNTEISQLTSTNQTNENVSIDYTQNPKEIPLYYVVNDEYGSINFTAYGGLNENLASKDRTIWCYDNVCPSERDYQLRLIDEPTQKIELQKLVEKIKETFPDKGDQARGAISIVQSIPYDTAGFLSNDDTEMYPYEVVYNKKGVCGEKSKLLAFILRELGFGVALLSYPEQRHMAVGIKCKNEYSIGKTGYCFIESTGPTIITDNKEDYDNVGALPEIPPEVIQISDGLEFDATEEYTDAREWIRLGEVGNQNNNILSPSDYSKWVTLSKKYGIGQDFEELSITGGCSKGAKLCGGKCYRCFPNQKLICDNGKVTCEKI